MSNGTMAVRRMGIPGHCQRLIAKISFSSLGATKKKKGTGAWGHNHIGKAQPEEHDLVEMLNVIAEATSNRGPLISQGPYKEYIGTYLSRTDNPLFTT